MRGETDAAAEAAAQADLRDNLWARVLPDGRGYAALHGGAPSALLQRLCVGEGEGGVYYVTLYADATSGDGRLWAGDGHADRRVLKPPPSPSLPP